MTLEALVGASDAAQSTSAQPPHAPPAGVPPVGVPMGMPPMGVPPMGVPPMGVPRQMGGMLPPPAPGYAPPPPRAAQPPAAVPKSPGEPREQDRLLPVANIQRIIRRIRPSDEKIAKDAKEALQECLLEFICFVTEEAAERTAEEKRKTVNGEDLLFALENLGFDEYVNPLRLYLATYRQTIKEKQAT